MMKIQVPPQVLVVAICAAASLLGDSALYTVLPANYKHLGIQLAYVGIFLSVNRFVRILFANTLAGYIHDHYHAWWHFVVILLIVSFITASYGLCLHVHPHSPHYVFLYHSHVLGGWSFLVARMLWGTCWSFLRLEGYVSVIQFSSAHNTGRLMGMYKSILSAGFLVGALLGGILTDSVGFQNCFLAFAMMIVIAAMFAYFAVSKELVVTRLEESRSHASSDLEITDGGTGQSLRVGWSIYYLGFINMFVNGSIVSSTLGLLLVGMRLPNQKVASLTGKLRALREGVSLFGSPLSGYFDDRCDRRIVNVSGIIVGVLGLYLLVSQDSLLGIGSGAILTAISGVLVSVSLETTIAEIASDMDSGKTVGVYTVFADAGAAFGPLIGFVISDIWGLPILYLVGIVLLLSAGFASCMAWLKG